MRPKLEIGPAGEGKLFLRITPQGPFAAAKQKVIEITEEDFRGIQRWREGYLIQQCLPKWSDAERELLLTGMDDAEFRKFLHLDDGDEAPPSGNQVA